MRLVLSSVLALAAAVLMRCWGGELPWALWLPTGLLGATALLVHHRRLTSQLLARAALWSNLGLGFLIATSGSSTERSVAAGLAACTGGALLLLGRHGLDATDRFAPVAFKTTIFTLFLLALALPLIAGLVRGRARPNPVVSRAGSLVAAIVVLALVGCSVGSALFVQGPLIHWN